MPQPDSIFIDQSKLGATNDIYRYVWQLHYDGYTFSFRL